MKEHNRGWFFPIAIVRLYEGGTLSAEDLILLGKINALQDPEVGGCWATNGYLAEQCGKASQTTRKRIRALVDLGLLRSKLAKDGQRVLQVTFAGDDTRVKTDPPSGQTRPNTRVKTDPHTIQGNKAQAGMRRQDCGGLVFQNGSFPSTNAGKLCAHFETFIKSRKLNLVVNRGGLKVTATINRDNWLRACSTLLEDSHPAAIKETMDWFFEHFRDEFTPQCASMITFAQKYKQIKSAMARANGVYAEDEDENKRMMEESERQRRLYPDGF